MCNPKRDLNGYIQWCFAQNTLSETKIQNLHPWERLRASLSLSNGSPPGQPARITAMKLSHEAVGCPGHCSFSCGTGCPDHCCSLPTVSTLPICPSECHTSCHELCPMHCCKVSSFSVSLCPSHCKTACDHLCPSHCCSQLQLRPAAVPIQPTCNPVCQSH